MTHASNRTTGAPWYKHPWVWLLISLPLSAVIGGMITLRLAIVSADGLVADDYDKRGKEINLVLERDHAASLHGLESVIELDYAGHTVDVSLKAADGYTPPQQVTMRLLHPTREGFDQTLTLERTASGAYRGAFADLPQGDWYIQLEADDWRLNGRLDMPKFSMLHIVAPPGPAAGQQG
jgi:hypothetical protein